MINPTTIEQCIHCIDGRWYVAHRDEAGRFWSYRKKDSGLWGGSRTEPDAWGYSYASKSAAIKRALQVYDLEPER